MLISKRLPSEHYTRLCDITLWVTKQYGPAKRPAVPKILSRGSLLSRWKEDNPTTVLDWASDNFARLLDDMDLCDLPLQLVANGEKADTYVQPEHNNTSFETKPTSQTLVTLRLWQRHLALSAQILA